MVLGHENHFQAAFSIFTADFDVFNRVSNFLCCLTILVVCERVLID